MPRQILVFAGRTDHFAGFVVLCSVKISVKKMYDVQGLGIDESTCIVSAFIKFPKVTVT